MPISSSSSSSIFPRPLKSAGPLCSCAPPYYAMLVSNQISERTSKTYILKTSDCLIYIARREFVKLFVVAKDDDCHVDRAENGKLMRLLEKTAFTLEECAARSNQQLPRSPSPSNCNARHDVMPWSPSTTSVDNKAWA